MLLNNYMMSVLSIATIITLSMMLSSPVQFVEVAYGEMKYTTYPDVELKWTPVSPTIDEEISFVIEFRDTGSEMPKSHIDYTFKISKEGNHLYTISNHTHSGTDTIKQKLSSDGVYPLTVTITGIDFKEVEPKSSYFSLWIKKPVTETVKKPVTENEQDEIRSITIPTSEKGVNIDGRWTTQTEWIDASETKIEDKELAYLRAKHDKVFLYIMLDFISDDGLEKSSDVGVVCFDTESDGSGSPLQDDYCFYRITRAGEFRDGIIQGNGGGWTILQESKTFDPNEEKFKARIGYSQMNDPYDSANKHVHYEFRIPIESYGLNETMGFYVYLNDAFKNEFIEWPVNGGGRHLALRVNDVLPAPDSWGELHMKLGKKESVLSEPEVQLVEEEEEKIVEVRVQAKQIKNLVIIRLRNMADSAKDIHAFRILLPDSLLKDFRGPREWNKERILDNGVVFSTSINPIHIGGKEYFILKVDDVKPVIQWTVYGSNKDALVEGSMKPFLR